jgi:microcystin-dependent protein
MAGTDWESPISSEQIETIIAKLKARDVDAATLFDVTDGVQTNVPAHAIRWNRGSFKFEEFDGVSVWSPLSIALGVNIGSMALQDANNVSIVGGEITADVDIAAAGLTGIVPPENLGTGSANSGTFLAGDSTWQAPVPVGSGAIWYTDVIPSGWLLCNGQAVSRTTYALLFGILGTTWGVGDGATTFNVPDLRGKFPFGKATAGTGSAIAASFGAIDHVHAGPSHTHTYTQVVNHTHPVVITDPTHKHTVATDGAAGVLAPAKTVGGAGATTMDTSLAATGITAVTTNPAGGVATGTTDASGTGATTSNNPPGAVVNFIIKAN